eukprot:scaffold300131_cov40-Tisochrysis_lutea.AAC.4
MAARQTACSKVPTPGSLATDAVSHGHNQSAMRYPAHSLAATLTCLRTCSRVGALRGLPSNRSAISCTDVVS